MLRPKPMFNIGDLVCERFPFPIGTHEIGTVTDRYEFENQYRYIVKFASGREAVFFEKELMTG